MKLTVDYVERDDLDLLKNEVQQRLDTGWKLLGGVVVNGNKFIQSLQREDGYSGPTPPTR